MLTQRLITRYSTRTSTSTHTVSAKILAASAAAEFSDLNTFTGTNNFNSSGSFFKYLGLTLFFRRAKVLLAHLSFIRTCSGQGGVSIPYITLN